MSPGRVRGRIPSRAAFLLPSAVTIGNVFLGFFAIVVALRGRFVLAAACIMVAGVLDTLDGKIARMLGTESEFGREFDSLADVLTFGLAPALVAHVWGLEVFPRIGWLVPFYYVVCCATRLARFNVQSGRVDSRYFVGLPSPAAAGGVTSFVLVCPHSDGNRALLFGMVAALILLGSLMVSTFRYWSLKALDLRKPFSYRVALPLAAIVLVLAYYPEAFLPALAIVFSASGPLHWAIGRLRHGRAGAPPTVPPVSPESSAP
jgi:CDP-diacylglycerol--serine O-phosphatidyltransferase